MYYASKCTQTLKNFNNKTNQLYVHMTRIYTYIAVK